MSVFILILLNGCSDSLVNNNNHPPQIVNFTANPKVMTVFNSGSLYEPDRTTLVCIATDEDKDKLTYIWKANWGEFLQDLDSPSIQWGCDTPQIAHITVYVTDGIEIDSARIELITN